MKSVKSDKPKLDKTPPSALEQLCAGCFWVVISGTLAVKVLFLVDTDLEITAKFMDKNWQVNLPSVRRYAIVINNFVDRQFSPISALIQRQSGQLMTQTGRVLATRKDWCIPISQLPRISIQPKRSNSTFLDDTTADRLAIRADKQPLSPPLQPATTSLQPPPATNPQADRDWCITTGTKP